MCQPLMVIDSVFKLAKNYYPQTFLEECTHKIKGKEIKSLIEDLESSDDDFEEEENFE